MQHACGELYDTGRTYRVNQRTTSQVSHLGLIYMTQLCRKLMYIDFNSLLKLREARLC